MFDFGYYLKGGERNPRKRAKLSASERIYIWEHPKLYGRKCVVCGDRITKISELELDHVKAFSKGGKKLALAHARCNKMKGSKPLSYVQKRMKFKTARKVKAKRRVRRRSREPKPMFPGLRF